MTIVRDPLVRCPAAGSIGKALRHACRIVCIDFSFDGDISPFKGSDCVSLRKEWEERKLSLRSKVRKERRSLRLLSVLKSCSRLFDAPCLVCDPREGNKARSAWLAHVDQDVVCDFESPRRWAENPLELLKTRVRELVGDSWGLREEGKRTRIPDQQGCLENERLTGGTFGVSELEAQTSRANDVRVGVAKTKGKFRVVTMQSARVKSILGPIHERLYDHISSFGWLVRGDVTKSDFERVADDLRKGEDLISGDYKSATDNIYLPAVLAIVEVLCESKHLTNLERETLRESFTDLHWVSRKGVRRRIKRGSMMGNLVSFPILCLLNKACFDMACDYAYRDLPKRRDRVRYGRFNGDDCCFCGSDTFFSLWREVVSTFGLVVNEEKTGRSRTWLELNSRQYDVVRHRFVGKPVLSFLRRTENNGDLLSEIVNGAKTLGRAAFWYCVVSLRWELSIREMNPSSLPGWVWRTLVKRKWFRDAIELGPLPIRSTGVDRGLPTSIGPPPRPLFYSFVEDRKAELESELVTRWIGKKVAPLEKCIDRRYSADRKVTLREQSPSARMLFLSTKKWVFQWPTVLLSFITDRFPQVLLTAEQCEDEWIEDHPLLSTRQDSVFRWRPGTILFQATPPPLILQVGVDNLPLLV